MIFVPLIPTALACMAVLMALVFSAYRGRWFKNQLAKLWTGRRRSVLHLETTNGFFFFMEMSLRLSEILLSIAVWVGLATVLWRPVLVTQIAAMVSFGICLRSAALWQISRHRSEALGALFDFDGYGTYWKARGDWRSRARASKSTIAASVVVLLAAIVVLLHRT
jgi:hypothetical protein